MSDDTRVTLVLPKALWDDVRRLVPSGQRSRLVVEALQSEIRRRQRLQQVSQLRQLRETLFAKYGELPSSAEDIASMREERDHGI